MQWLGIVVLSILACVVYGIIHDQITVRICIEYFTIAHPRIFKTQDPTLLGLGWGIVATWWVGAIIGIPLATVCRFGSTPKIQISDISRSVLVLMICCGLLAALAGLGGFIASANRWVFLTGPLAVEIPRDKHVPFFVDLWMHHASYLGGAVGGILLILKTWRSRFSRSCSGKEARQLRLGPEGESTP